MRVHRVVTFTASVGASAALLTFPAALVLAIILERWHTRHYDIDDFFEED